ncbi:MAG: WYL domain-containing protein [Carnobacterium sp.]|nr:WYL domain-containing protein [Carnobacterium sp.]
MSSNIRITEILFKLMNDNSVSIVDLSKEYQVEVRTIQRDIATIKQVAECSNLFMSYDKRARRYSLVTPDKLIFEDALAMTKILLASRSLTTAEMKKILYHIISLTPKKERDFILKSIKNELTFYYPLEHKKDLLEKIKKMTHFISKKIGLFVSYKKNDGFIITRQVLPVSLFFSEYYFYVICYEANKKRYINLRLDRFIEMTATNQIFLISHKDRIEERELREKMLFMYSGDQQTFVFRFWGIVEAALDKFPTSKIIHTYEDTSVDIQATAHDTGAIMWLLSQGSNVKVLSPNSLVEKMKEEIRRMIHLYE